MRLIFITGEIIVAKAPRKSNTRRRELPPTISTEAGLAQHLAALGDIDKRFVPILEVAGEVSLRWLEPGFKGLFKVVTGQQISAAAGSAIFTRCAAMPAAMHPVSLAEVEDESLRAAGLSSTKIRTLRAVAEAICAGTLDLDALAVAEPEQAIAQLVTVRGIGRWTAEVYLLFAAGHPDIFPAGDLALREAACQSFALAERPTEKALAAMALDWRPYRSAAARLLWAYYAAIKRGRDGTPA